MAQLLLESVGRLIWLGCPQKFFKNFVFAFCLKKVLKNKRKKFENVKKKFVDTLDLTINDCVSQNVQECSS